MVHLHTRSCYSLLHSPFRIQEIIDTAASMHFRHVCLTDLHSMYGTMEFWKYAQKKSIHPIIGLEVHTVWNEAPFSFVLLAKNDLGLQQLYHVSTCLMKGDKTDAEQLASMTSQCIALTAGDNDTLEQYVEHEDTESIENYLNKMASLWDDFYVSIAMNDSSYRRQVNQFLKACTKHIGLDTVALSRIYYRTDRDVESLRMLQAIEQQKTIYDQTLNVSNHRYFRSQAEMEALYDPEDLLNTERIASQCNVQMSMTKSRLPVFINKLGIDNDKYLIKLCHAGLLKRMNRKVPDVYKNRLDYELSVIIKMGFTDYFLIVWDFIRFARSQNINVGPGRGSAAGSLAAYCLGITHIDPIRNHLLFERFLNPERISMPDIDTDFPDDKRDDVIDYVYDKYGAGHVAHIIAFNTLKAKQVLRDVARITNYPPRKVDAIAKSIGNDSKMTLEKAYHSNAYFARLIQADAESRELYERSLKLEGLPRHLTLHAAGIVLSDQEIEKVCPLVQVEENMEATQFPMEDLEDLGLIKMDFLSLKNLTTIHEIKTSIEKNTNVTIPLLQIPLNDRRTYQLLSRADTLGVFQLESQGIMQLLKKMQPQCFEDICAVLALYRPGPMKNIDTYLDKRAHPETIEYPDRRLEPILKETYGIILYQEQIMQIAQVIGGFTLSQADTLRKAMSKKNAQTMASYRQTFVQGALKNGCRTKVAEDIFDLMERFAEYGFNKSHSYVYGLVAYQMAYLKANYPVYFYQGLLNSVIGSEIKTSQYIYECQHRQINVLPPSVNDSQALFAVQPQGLRMPLRTIKGIGRMVHEQIEKSRQQKRFTDFIDFVVRITAERVNESNIRALIDAGALDELGLNRMTMNENLGRVLQYAAIVQTVTDQGVLFNYDLVSLPKIIPMKEDRLKKAQKEKMVYGFYLSEHPVHSIRKNYPKCTPVNRIQNGYVQVIGKVNGYRTHRTKNGQLMCFMTIEDETGQLDIVIMPKLYEMQKEHIRKDRIVIVQGKKDREHSVLANRMNWHQEKETMQ